MKDKVYIRIVKKDEVFIDSEIEFPKNITRCESKKAFSLLKKMLMDLGYSFSINDILYTDNGKLYINNSMIKFNYSHSNKYIACAVSLSDVGIDIEDEFNISDDAKNIYLHGIDSNLRDAWVIKESYCKLLGNFNDNFFINMNIDDLKENNYFISNESYSCSVFYSGHKKNLIITK